MSLREEHIRVAFGASTVDVIHRSKVLVVGAGGIGCELIKNLVLTGFRDLHVIDLDTIDVSNLNRQFLFRPQHVGRSKADVAREAAMEFNPECCITSYHANIKEERFGLDFFRQFNLVIDALDNVSARKHVNRLCLAAEKPLIEAGTQGYLGQAVVIRKGVTECFECTPQTPQKKFPICTIRSTPDKPVHCVVWAKELHKLLFGDSRASYLFESSELGASSSSDPSAPPATGSSSEDSASPPAASTESVYMHEVVAAPRDACVDDFPAVVVAWAERLFDAIFNAEIVKRLEMAPETYKTAAQPPKPLRLSAIMSATPGTTSQAEVVTAGGLKDQRVLSLRESATLFLDSITQYYASDELRGSIGSLDFSKDSALDLDFVTAATNLRAFTFGIPMQSRFDVKSIAGNIIPAIATTNAIVAGLEVIEAVKILRGDDIAASCAQTWIARSEVSGNKLLLSTKVAPPNSNCYVCGTRGVTVFLDTNTTTLREFIDKVLVGSLAFNSPNINNNESFFFIEDRDADEDDEEYAQKMSFLPLPLVALVGGGIHHNSVLDINDFSQDLVVRLTISHRDQAEFDELKHPQFFELTGDSEAANLATRLDEELAAKAAASEKAKVQGTLGAAVCAGMEPAATGTDTVPQAATPAVAGQKRSRAEAELLSPQPGASAPVPDETDKVTGVQPDAKRPRPNVVEEKSLASASDEVIEID